MKSNQARTQTGKGCNIVGKGPTKHRLHQPPKFMGSDGQSNNQSINRGKGKT